MTIVGPKRSINRPKLSHEDPGASKLAVREDILFYKITEIVRVI